MRAGREACVYLAVLPPLRYTLFARKWTRKTERETRGATRHGLESGSAGVSGCRVRTKVLSSYACVRRALLARVDLAVTAWLRPGRTYGQAICICLFSSAVDHTPSPPREKANPQFRQTASVTACPSPPMCVFYLVCLSVCQTKQIDAMRNASSSKRRILAVVHADLPPLARPHLRPHLPPRRAHLARLRGALRREVPPNLHHARVCALLCA